MTISMAKARLLMDTISRVSHATKQLVRITNSMSSQLHDEDNVLREAKAYLEAIINQT